MLKKFGAAFSSGSTASAASGSGAKATPNDPRGDELLDAALNTDDHALGVNPAEKPKKTTTFDPTLSPRRRGLVTLTGTVKPSRITKGGLHPEFNAVGSDASFGVHGSADSAGSASTRLGPSDSAGRACDAVREPVLRVSSLSSGKGACLPG